MDIEEEEILFYAQVPITFEQQSINDSSLRHLPGLFLSSVIRNEETIRAVNPEFEIHPLDIIAFSGLRTSFDNICKERNFLNLMETPINPVAPFLMVSRLLTTSTLIGKTIKEIDFPHRFGVMFVSACRNSIQISVDDEVRVSDDIILFSQNQKNVELLRKEFEIESKFKLAASDYLVAMEIHDSPLSGKSIKEVQYRLFQTHLLGITREKNLCYNVNMDFRLRANDTLWFSGGHESYEMLRKIPGLSEVKQLKIPSRLKLIEIVPSIESELLFKTIKESKFRTRFDAVVVAVKRKGTRLLSKIGDITILPGDILYLETGLKFKSDSNFAILSETCIDQRPRGERFLTGLTERLISNREKLEKSSSVETDLQFEKELTEVNLIT